MSLIKFADDTALIGLISKDDDSAFLSQVDSFVNHCDANYLELNVSKTKRDGDRLSPNQTRPATGRYLKEVPWQELTRTHI